MIGFFLLFAGIVLIFVAGWLNSTALMTMGFFLALFCAAALLATAISLVFLRITGDDYAGRAVKGLPGEVRVRPSVHISPALAPYIILRYRVSVNGKKQRGRVLSPLSGGEAVALPFAAEECGLLHIRVTSVRVPGLFGLFSLWKLSRVQYEIPVFPDDEAADAVSAAPGRVEDAEGRTPLAAARGTEVRDLSAYNAGDEARSIHWPASARLSKLMKKDYSEDRRRIVFYAAELPAAPAEVDECACRISSDVLASLAAGFAVQIGDILISSRDDLDRYLENVYRSVETAATEKKTAGREKKKRPRFRRAERKRPSAKAETAAGEGGIS